MTAVPTASRARPARQAFTVERIQLRIGSMRLKEPFTTSFGTVHDRPLLYARVTCDGIDGWAESAATHVPAYSEETIGTNVLMIREHLAPMVLGRCFDHPRDVADAWSAVKGNPMAKATLEQAVWDAVARRDGVSLSHALGGVRDRVPAGVSLGVPADGSVAGLAEVVAGHVDAGYARIKVKIRPGWDVEVMAALRERFPATPLMADANAAYRVADASHLARLDPLGLTMIEQPLDHDDLVDHAELAARIQTPICLDESVRTAADVRRAASIGAGSIVNIKVGRLGGHTGVLQVHEMALAHGIQLWCGGMLESGVGRLHNLAIASLAGCTLPGDTSASDRYWHHDVVDPPVRLDPDGTVAVPTGPGIGSSLDVERIEAIAPDVVEVTCSTEMTR